MMRIFSVIKKLLVIILVSLMMTSCFFCGYAVEPQPLELKTKCHIELLTEEPKRICGFSCFDVNEFGYYAVLTKGIPAFVIAVYSPDGEFCYGISLKSSGSIAIRWEEGDIAVYFARNDIKIRIDEKGNVTAAEQYSSDTKYWELLNNTKTVNGKTYIAKHWLVSHELIRWGNYTQLVMGSNEGEKILFDGTRSLLHKTGLCFLLSILIIAVLAIVANLLLYRKRRARKKEGCGKNLFLSSL